MMASRVWRGMAGVLAMVLLCAADPALATGQTVDEIVAKYVDATGGAGRWAAMHSMTVSSRSAYFSFDSLWKKPNMVRVDVWSDASVDTDTRSSSGTTGWRLNSAEGSPKPRTLSAAETAELRDEIDWMRELVDYKAKGLRITLLPARTVDGQTAHVLELTRPSGAMVHIFLDAKTGLEVQRVKWATSPDGEPAEIVLPVGDYRTVSGLLLPHRVGTAARTYQVNVEIADARFQQPGRLPERDFATQKVASAIAQLLPVGTMAPSWALKDAHGRVHRSSEYLGKIVVLDFWATWCAPCHRMMPGLQRLHDAFSGRGVVVIGISTSEHGGDPAQLMKDRGYSYTLLLNGEAISKSFHVVGMPVVYVVGRDGRILHADVGADDAAAEARRALITRVLTIGNTASTD